MRMCEMCKSTASGLSLCHLVTFTTTLIIFVYYVYALVLFIEYCIVVLATFWAIFICIIR